MSPQPAEIFLPFPAPLKPATSFRSTWLASSLATLRQFGHFDAYLAELPREHHDAVLLSVAGEWLPIDVAIAHYEACGRLGLATAVISEAGRAVTQRVHGTSLGTLVRLAKQTGATPWVALSHLNRLWERVWEGGGLRVTKLGEKDALIEVGAWPVAKVHYIHLGMPAVAESVLSLFCRRAFVRDVPEKGRDDLLVLRASWA